MSYNLLEFVCKMGIEAVASDATPLRLKSVMHTTSEEVERLATHAIKKMEADPRRIMSRFVTRNAGGDSSSVSVDLLRSAE